MFGRLLRWYTLYTFSGDLAPDGILPGAKFTLRPSLAFSYIGGVTTIFYPPWLLHGTSSAGVSHTWRHGTRNGITELLERAPPIIGWAAITLGNGLHF